MGNQDHRAGGGKLPGGRGKAEDGEPLPGAEDEESRPLDRRGQPRRRPRTGSHCLWPKMRNQEHRTGVGNLPGGRGKAEDR